MTRHMEDLFAAAIDEVALEGRKGERRTCAAAPARSRASSIPPLSNLVARTGCKASDLWALLERRLPLGGITSLPSTLKQLLWESLLAAQDYLLFSDEERQGRRVLSIQHTVAGMQGQAVVTHVSGFCRAKAREEQKKAKAAEARKKKKKAKARKDEDSDDEEAFEEELAEQDEAERETSQVRSEICALLQDSNLGPTRGRWWQMLRNAKCVQVGIMLAGACRCQWLFCGIWELS